MSKFLVETHYTCTFKIVHELDELNEKALSEVDSRKDGKVEIVNVTVNNRKTKRSDGKKTGLVICQSTIPKITKKSLAKFDLVISRELEDFQCMPLLGQEPPCNLEIEYTHTYQGWQYDKEENYTINLSADMDIQNVYSITGKTNEISFSDIGSFSIVNDGLDILEGQISNCLYLI